MRPTSRRAILATTLVLGAALSGAAHGRAQFGLGTQKLHIPFSAFKPRYPSLFQYAAQCCGSGGYVTSFSTAPGAAAMMAELDESVLPKGVEITHIAVYFRDDENDLDANLLVALCRTWVNSFSGFDPSGDCPIVVTPASPLASPGDTVLQSANEDVHVADYTGDPDGDTGVDEVAYTLLLDFGVGSMSRAYFGDGLRLYEVVIYFHRQVSPPFGAAFVDVPPLGDEESIAIQALKNAGITDGCNAIGNRFCPDLPVTRRQLAVFLARALGLHWGNN